MIKDKCCDWPIEQSDGLRLMTMAKYPRGRSKEICDVFLPDLAPDWETVKSFLAQAISWERFASLYRKKLREPNRRHQLELLSAVSDRLGQNVTVMCSCEDRETCHRSILVDEIRKSHRLPGTAPR